MTVKEIVKEMNEPKPLPIGMTEFEEWASRIILGAVLPATVDRDGLLFTLASMILSLGPTESHKPDAHFIHGLRKAAANQIAYAQQQASHQRVKTRLAKEETLAAVGSGGSLTLVRDEALLDDKKV